MFCIELQLLSTELSKWVKVRSKIQVSDTSVFTTCHKILDYLYFTPESVSFFSTKTLVLIIMFSKYLVLSYVRMRGDGILI